MADESDDSETTRAIGEVIDRVRADERVCVQLTVRDGVTPHPAPVITTVERLG